LRIGCFVQENLRRESSLYFANLELRLTKSTFA